MLTAEQIKIIDDYVNNDYFDTEKLKKYLNLHEIVGNEVFDYVDRKNKNLNRKEAHDMMLDDEVGYEPISVDIFVRRVPFYFYSRNGEIGTHGETIGDVLRSKWKEIKIGEITLEEIYLDFEYLFYEKQISPYYIFNYITEQTGLVTEEYFFEWLAI